MFGGFQSSDEFNPFAFLNQYLNGLQAQGVNIHLVFEGPGGGGLGHEFDFGLPSNPRDYFVVPRLEQLIQLPRTIPIVCRYESLIDDPNYENGRTGQVSYNSRNSNNSNLGMASGGGDQETGTNDNQLPRTMEKRVKLPLQAALWLPKGSSCCL
ncbi:E3 ubiquitin- ligase RING1-like [Olea europaea subsp. europaea]|uniref:E3 ubiquitin- ligase RING1-like n=1 Tax=Olea europaea subsp. europaea TaxID=158383 RepID=A0A8S0T5I5_OLEEU|nr:E3 ubiquitin- ligase RING1-like [Olea europaea subsp. europaea]